MVPTTSVPTGWLLTNARNASGSFTGSTTRPPRELDAAFLAPDRDRGAACLPPDRSGAALSDGGLSDSGLSDAGFSCAALLVADFFGPVFFAVALSVDFCARAARWVERRLATPRTGERSTNTQPTPAIGLPPMRRPSSNNHVYCPWNSWNESLEKTVASARFAIDRTNASPRPIAP